MSDEEIRYSINYAPVSVHIVVKRQLLVLHYLPLRKNTHSDVWPNLPLCDMTIWITAVIRESTDASTFSSIDELRRRIN